MSAQAGEAGTATTTKIGVVHEHAVAKRCAHTLKLIINHTRGPAIVGAIAASQHRAGREPSHLTVSRPYGRPSHIAVTNTRLITVRCHKVPTPRGHRQWIGDKR